MDIKISGSGTISGGEYDSVKIAGSGHCQGKIRCISFKSSGSAHCNDDVDCADKFSSSGSAHLDKDLTAGDLHSSGICKIDGDCKVKRSISTSGSCVINGNCISSGEVLITGGISVGGGLEAESVTSTGRINCRGLLNAETVQIFGHGACSKIGSIGGSRIEVRPYNKIFGCATILTVEESIEGDEINLEYTEARCVTGRTVVIGDGCKIETLRYSESADISPNARVNQLERI